MCNDSDPNTTANDNLKSTIREVRDLKFIGYFSVLGYVIDLVNEGVFGMALEILIYLSLDGFCIRALNKVHLRNCRAQSVYVCHMQHRYINKKQIENK